ncbi:shikimate kinase [Nitrosospira briensis]|uniref:Shikimate kinase n=2 Tax=Nitrosospira briensis TaxID=35799 RepID=A0A1I5A5T6_9PROT|nr:shikimate kinase [Nitrosospira briensis]
MNAINAIVAFDNAMNELVMDEARGNIFLVGMMGAGKTTIGRLLAGFLKKTFYDSDREIQKRTGVSIPLIFEIEGEAGFRKRETEMLSELVKTRNIVLATGGGAVLSAQNREMLKQSGTVIYLRATVDDLWRRTRQDKNRPLLQTQDPRTKLLELYGQRDPLYQETAHIIVESGKRSARHLAQLLAQQLACSR